MYLFSKLPQKKKQCNDYLLKIKLLLQTKFKKA